jgi:hypothetical protein
MSPVADYEVFEYKYFDEPVLSLNQAAEKAAALRKADSAHFYRIVPHEQGFIVVKVPVSDVYAERSGGIFGRMYRWVLMQPPRLTR